MMKMLKYARLEVTLDDHVLHVLVAEESMEMCTATLMMLNWTLVMQASMIAEARAETT
jgi:hypothetical protein